jgi:hypothetical protein
MRGSTALDFAFSEAISAFDRSTFGASLERAWLYTVPSIVRREDVTAWPKPAKRSDPAITPSIEVMTKAGEVHRRLMRLTPDQRAILQAYHGADGAVWRGHKRGSYVALYPATKAGRELIERTRRVAKGADLDVSDRERFRTTILLDDTTGGRNELIRRLLTLADREARALYDEAIRAWEALR